MLKLSKRVSGVVSSSGAMMGHVNGGRDCCVNQVGFYAIYRGFGLTALKGAVICDTVTRLPPSVFIR